MNVISECDFYIINVIFFNNFKKTKEYYVYWDFSSAGNLWTQSMISV